MRLRNIGVRSSIDATAVGVFSEDSGFAIASHIATYVNTPWGWAASIRPLFLFLFLQFLLFVVFFPSSSFSSSSPSSSFSSSSSSVMCTLSKSK